MYTGRHYMAISGSALFLIVLFVSATLVLGVGGQQPVFIVLTQTSYEIGHMGFLVINAHNQWWGRTVDMYGVSIQVNNGTVTPIGVTPLLLWPLQQRSAVLSFVIPQGTPLGTQSFLVRISFTQSTLLLAGQESVQISIAITINVTS